MPRLTPVRALWIPLVIACVVGGCNDETPTHEGNGGLERPTGLVATAESSRTIALTWTPVDPSALAVEVYRRQLSEAAWTLLDATDAHGHFIDDTVSPGQTYVYRVRAIADGVVSAYSDEATATAMAVVHVSVGEGVLLHGLAIGVTEVLPGTDLSYEAELVEGHRNPAVLFDGALLGATGTVTAVGEHGLLASGDEMIDQAAVEELVGDLTEAWSEEDPATLTSSIEVSVRNALTGRTAAEASALVAEAEAVMDLPVARAAALSGKATRISNGPAGGSVLGQSGNRIGVVFVNGIWNSYEQGLLAAQEVAVAMGEIPAPNVETWFFYNYSETQAIWQCLLNVAALGGYGLVGIAAEWAECGVELAYADLEEALRQIANLEAGGVSPPAEDALKLAQFVKNEFLDKGDAVILVGHSQGNLMIQEALDATGVIEADARPRIGYVALASPLLSVAPGVGAFGDVLVRHDLMELGTNLGLVTYNIGGSIETSLSRMAEDDIWEAIDECGFGLSLLQPERCIEIGVTLLYWGLKTHTMAGSYLGTAEARQRTKEIVGQQLELVASGADGASELTLSVSPVVRQTIEEGGEVAYEIGVQDDVGTFVGNTTVVVADGLKGLSTSVTADASGMATYTTRAPHGSRGSTHQLSFHAQRAGYLSSATLARSVAVDEPPSDQLGVIQGRVAVETEPLDGVEVALGGAVGGSTVTDAAGAYVFDRLRGGAYTVSVGDLGPDMTPLVEVEDVILDGPADTVVVDVNAQWIRTSSILVTVLDAEGDGVVVDVAITGPGNDFVFHTNSDGQVQFSGLRAGTYRIELRSPPPGFTQTTREFALATGEAREIVFQGS